MTNRLTKQETIALAEHLERLREEGLKEDVFNTYLKYKDQIYFDKAIILRIGEVLEQSGYPVLAASLYQRGYKYFKTQYPEILLNLISLFLELKEYDKAFSIMSKLSPEEIFDDPIISNSIKKIFEELNGLYFFNKKFSRREAEPETLMDQGLEADTDMLDKMVQRFSGNEKGYYLFDYDPGLKETIELIEKPLTTTVLHLHLKGDHTVCINPLRIDNTLTFFAVHIKQKKTALFDKIKRDGNFFVEKNRLESKISSLYNHFRSKSLTPIIAKDGKDGFIFYFFFSKTVNIDGFKNIRKEVLDILKVRGFENLKYFHVKVIPESARSKEVVPLPLGIHPLTGKRMNFVDEELAEFNDSFAPLENIDNFIIDPDTLLHPFSNLSLNHLTQTTFHGQKEAILIQKCPVLKKLYLLFQNWNINDKQLFVLVNIVMHLGETPIFENLSKNLSYDIKEKIYNIKRKTLKKISCPKIRALIPEITSKVNCNCQFPPHPSSYPHPLRHLQTVEDFAAQQINEQKLTVKDPKLIDTIEDFILLTINKKKLLAQIEQNRQTIINTFNLQPGTSVEINNKYKITADFFGNISITFLNFSRIEV